MLVHRLATSTIEMVPYFRWLALRESVEEFAGIMNQQVCHVISSVLAKVDQICWDQEPAGKRVDRRMYVLAFEVSWLALVSNLIRLTEGCMR